MPASGRTAWGWHRLTDDWARTIVTDAAIRRGELVLDIGAGDGALTSALLEAGARVVAIELHPERLQVLRARFGDDPRVKVVRADARDLFLPRRPFRVVANPPFSVTSALLHRLVARGSRLVAADLVLERAAARRFAAGARVGPSFTYIVRLGRPIPRPAFRPRPTVDSAVLVIRRR